MVKACRIYNLVSWKKKMDSNKMCSYDRYGDKLGEHPNVFSIEQCMRTCMRYSSCKYIEWFKYYNLCVTWDARKQCDQDSYAYVTQNVFIYEISRGH